LNLAPTVILNILLETQICGWHNVLYGFATHILSVKNHMASFFENLKDNHHE